MAPSYWWECLEGCFFNTSFLKKNFLDFCRQKMKQAVADQCEAHVKLIYLC